MISLEGENSSSVFHLGLHLMVFPFHGPLQSGASTEVGLQTPILSRSARASRDPFPLADTSHRPCAHCYGQCLSSYLWARVPHDVACKIFQEVQR